MKALIIIIWPLFILLTIFQILALNKPAHDLIALPLQQTPAIVSQRHQLLDHLVGRAALNTADYSQSELEHIADIKKVLKNVQQFYYLLVLATLIILVLARRRGPAFFFKRLMGASRAGLILLIGSGLLLALFFQPLFYLLHQIIFPAGNWQFAPVSDLIIQIYPPEFFRWFVLAWLGFGCLILLVCFLLVKKYFV